MEIRNESKIEIIKLSMIVFTIIISLIVLSKTFLERNKESEVIQVTGLGTKDFESDLIVWSGSFSQIDIDLKNAYERLQ
ncbi:SIMPL domain-containing protein, partial [Treponema denticola]